ncbi:hypothetical protein FGO68_gene11011 [Halteria grandinella]|uniref:Uncharacterized protein n=1 Tax=Halteria grandinella TaxID=5974 RepID=A0A8J8P4W0_HALGN|nr:hypothetical protein FGO68_gene11011 [Halteria grandinella]
MTQNSRYHSFKNYFFSAITIQNFTVNIEHFKEAGVPRKTKSYTLGVFFESTVIEAKIKQIENQFYHTYIFLFVVPFLVMVIIFLVCEIIFIMRFTRKIFRTINDLYDKIDMLSKQQRKAFKYIFQKT